MRLPTVVAAVALLGVGFPSRAQVPDDTSHLGRGIVGLEAGYGQMPGALAFLFSSSSTSWLLGMDRVTKELVVGSRVVRSVSAGLRFGVRKWPPGMTGPFKVFVGAGLATADVEPDQPGKEFGYGELGAVYFLGRHVSLVATGELALAYGTRDDTIYTNDRSNDRLFVRGTRFRVGTALYLF